MNKYQRSLINRMAKDSESALWHKWDVDSETYIKWGNGEITTVRTETYNALYPELKQIQESGKTDHRGRYSGYRIYKHPNHSTN